jgi:hypothetical protein
LLPVRSGLNPAQLSLNIQKGRHDGLCDPCQAMKGGSIEGGSAPIGAGGSAESLAPHFINSEYGPHLPE